MSGSRLLWLRMTKTLEVALLWDSYMQSEKWVSVVEWLDEMGLVELERWDVKATWVAASEEVGCGGSGCGMGIVGGGWPGGGCGT